MKIATYTTFLFLSQLIYSQTNHKPKWVVEILVDQTRAEYLYRFQANFKRQAQSPWGCLLLYLRKTPWKHSEL